MKNIMKKLLPVLLVAFTMVTQGVAPAVAAPLVEIETVQIGSPENVADTVEQWDETNGYGSVGYTYAIGKYEVTVAQYTAFLNAVDSGGTNSLGLYNGNMSPEKGSQGCGIVLDGDATDGSKYSVAGGYEGKPVNYVSWWDAARFCNWLTNGQPADGSGTETGMYTLNSHAEDGDVSIVRNADAWAGGGYAITSEDEWYKAAYYNTNGTETLDDDTYTLYATGDTITTGQANYYGDGYSYTDENGNHLAPVGTYAAAEQNGTFDMMGNVFEWNDTTIENNYRGLRGGSFENLGNYDYLASSARNRDTPASESYGFYGFRVAKLVAAVPEPSTYGILGGAAALLGAIALRRRNRRD